jgi:hypothetical protein
MMEGKIGIRITTRIEEVISSLLSEDDNTTLTEEDVNLLTADRARGILSPRIFKLISDWNQKQHGPPLFCNVKDVKAELPRLKVEKQEVGDG